MLLEALYTDARHRRLGGDHGGTDFLAARFLHVHLFSLALLKRYTELLALREINISATRGRDYNVTDLALLANMGAGSGYVATLVLALFINSPDLATRYSRPYALWVLCPLFLYWISRLWLKAGRGEMHDDPLIYAVKDRVVGMFLQRCCYRSSAHFDDPFAQSRDSANEDSVVPRSKVAWRR